MAFSGSLSVEVETVLVEVAHFEATVLTVRVWSPGAAVDPGGHGDRPENDGFHGDFFNGCLVIFGDF